MLQKKLSSINYFFFKIFKINNLSYVYIKFIFIVYNFFYILFKDLFNTIYVFKKYKIFLNKFFLFKNTIINKKNFYHKFIFKNINYLGISNLVLKTKSINSYIIQKNFSFYYHSMFSKKFDVSNFIIVLDLKKIINVMNSFKVILFNLYFYNIKIIVWGTSDFEDEVCASNEVFSIKNFNKINLKSLIIDNVFIKDLTYNLKINFFFRNFSLLFKRNLVFIVLQNTGNGALILNRFKYFSFGCFTNLKLKHTYSFLIPVHIRHNFSKFYMYSFLLSYKNIVYKYQLLFFLLYYFKYKIFLKLN